MFQLVKKFNRGPIAMPYLAYAITKTEKEKESIFIYLNNEFIKELGWKNELFAVPYCDDIVKNRFALSVRKTGEEMGNERKISVNQGSQNKVISFQTLIKFNLEKKKFLSDYTVHEKDSDGKALLVELNF